MSRRLTVGLAVVAALAVAAIAWSIPPGRDDLPPAFAAARERPRWNPDGAPDAARLNLLRRARVWTDSNPAIADLAANPPDPAGTLSGPLVRCRYRSTAAHGTTQKFECVLRDGEVVKVKYGRTGEIHAEVAATRLLAALGFGADRMYLIPRLRCYGCLRSPFYAVALLDYVRARDVVTESIPENRYTDFEWVAVERRFEGAEVQTANAEGWAWFELDEIDPSSGANRAERDALRLAAIMLAHWDNKAENQRLVARPEPFAYIHDLGATFGPNKLDLDHWRDGSIWDDPAACTVSMRSLPYHGGTFRDATISEAGRRLLARQLHALSERQIEGLFAAGRFDDVSAWTRTFREKVRQIDAAGPCE